MRYLTLHLLLLLAATTASASAPDSVRTFRCQAGLVLQAGASLQRAAKGSDFDPAYFSYTKAYTSYGAGLRVKVALPQQLEARVGYTYARRGHSFNQHNFDIPNSQSSVNYTLYNMAHEMGIGLTRVFCQQKKHSFSAGIGYSYNIHEYTMEVYQSQLGDVPSGGAGYEFLLDHGDLRKKFNSHTLSAEVNYLPRIGNSRPLEVSLSYHHDLTSAPVMQVQSARLDANQQVVQTFTGKMVPANSSLRLGLAWYLLRWGSR